MRKFFEGHSLTGVVIISCAFVLAVLLRFLDLSDQSPWTDEIASWWYLRHLDTVFYRESHSPLFYGILRVFLGSDPTITAIRSFVAGVSVIHLIEFFFLGQLALKKRAFLIFWVFVCLNPADIVHARMARHYSWLLEGSLVYFLLWKIESKHWLKILTGTFTSFIHVFAAIPIAVLAGYDFFRSRNWRNLAINLIPCYLVSLYYLLRIITQGGDQVRSNLWWVKASFFNFISSTMTQFLGDSFPRFEFYPVSQILTVIVLGASLFLLLYFRKKSGIVFLLLCVATVLIVEALIPWANFRVNRYVIYLSGIWLFAIAESLEDVKDYILYPVLSLPFFYLVYFNPLLKYPWENERVAFWNGIREKDQVSQQLVCANDYQSEYYGLNHASECVERARSLDPTKPILFFDLGATQTFAVAPLLKSMDVAEHIPLDYGGLIVKLTPKVPETTKQKKRKK